MTGRRWESRQPGRRGVKAAAETPGGAVCSDSWVWRGVRVGVRGARRAPVLIKVSQGGRRSSWAGRWEAVCIKVSQGGRRSSWPGRWEAVCSDSCIWRWWSGYGGMRFGMEWERYVGEVCRYVGCSDSWVWRGVGVGMGIGMGVGVSMVWVLV